MPFEFLEPWHLFLPRGGGHVVSVFGGGGKTTILKAFAGILEAEGVPVIVTTTTRTEVLHWPDLGQMTWDDLVDGVRPAGMTTFVHNGLIENGESAPDGKWLGLAPDQVDRIAEFCPGHVVLVEADGSARHPVKLHRSDEPVWPRRTSLAVACVGLSALGRPASEVLHRWDRIDRAGLDLENGSVEWDWRRTTGLLLDAGGYRDLVPAETPVVLALLQMDECRDSIGLFSFLDAVMNDDAFPVVAIGDVSGTSPDMRTAFLSETLAGERE